MLVYLLYSRLINLVVIPKFYKFSAQFFTLLSYEPITVCFLPTCFKVYNLGLKCKASGCVNIMLFGHCYS